MIGRDSASRRNGYLFNGIEVTFDRLTKHQQFQAVNSFLAYEYPLLQTSANVLQLIDVLSKIENCKLPKGELLALLRLNAFKMSMQATFPPAISTSLIALSPIAPAPAPCGRTTVTPLSAQPSATDVLDSKEKDEVLRVASTTASADDEVAPLLSNNSIGNSNHIHSLNQAINNQGLLPNLSKRLSSASSGGDSKKLRTQVVLGNQASKVAKKNCCTEVMQMCALL